MAARTHIPAKPNVLRWARETSGKSVSSAAVQLGIPAAELLAIEEGRGPVTPPVFQRMIVAYGRVESVLLLPEPPAEDALPEDYRTVGGALPAVSPETLLAIREARRIQHYVSELRQDDDTLLPKADIPRAAITDDPDELATRERERFQVSVETVGRWQPGREAFARWRDIVQSRGILVFVTQMPWDDCRGLALWGGVQNDAELVPAIVINREDAFVARTFTLFHEYAHLLLRESASCLEAQNDTSKGAVERWCNRFAAAFLVPADRLREAASRLKLGSVGWSMEQVRRVATGFRVSRSAMARRLHELGLSDFYLKNSSALHAFDRLRSPQKREEDEIGGVRPAVRRFAELGSAAGVVITAVRNETIDGFEAADALGINPSSLQELETLVVARRVHSLGA